MRISDWSSDVCSSDLGSRDLDPFPSGRAHRAFRLYRPVQYLLVPADADLLEMHRRMLVIRGCEQRVAALYRDGEVPGFVHLSVGQEAAAVGACWPLGAADVITSTHRGHGHCLAKDRKSVVEGKGGSVRLDIGWRR